MKSLLVPLILSGVIGLSMAQSNQKKNVVPVNEYASIFEKAYRVYPQIPKGILEAVAFNNTRFSHLTHEEKNESCTGMPLAYGVMGLMRDGKGVFNNNLITVAELSGYSVDDVMKSPETNIMAFAKAYNTLMQKNNISNARVQDQRSLLRALSEFKPTSTSNDFALNSSLYVMYSFLNKDEYQKAYGLPEYNIDLEAVFGKENYRVLSSSYITIEEDDIKNKEGDEYKVNSADYAPAIWNPAASCNYTYGRSQSISAVTVHTTQGSYAGTISWFKNCSANVSAHYVIRSYDGQVTQMVREYNTAWHVGSSNSYTIGIEHEGYISNPNWYTYSMYQASANLVRNICFSGYGIHPLETYFAGGCSGGSANCYVSGCYKVKGHQMFPYQSHTDPGPHWNWHYYYALINKNTPVATKTASSGTFYDDGGSQNNYSANSRQLVLIDPPGSSQVNLSIPSFNTEAYFDRMFIYDGNSIAAPRYGPYSGTYAPSTFTSSGGAVVVEFRSDCSLTKPGYRINWSSGAGTSSTTLSGNIESNADLRVYPNPSAGNITIEFKDTMEGSLLLMDVTGKVVFRDEVVSTRLYNLQTTDFNEGVYFLQLNSADMTYSRRLVFD